MLPLLNRGQRLNWRPDSTINWKAVALQLRLSWVTLVLFLKHQVNLTVWRIMALPEHYPNVSILLMFLFCYFPMLWSSGRTRWLRFEASSKSFFEQVAPSGRRFQTATAKLQSKSTSFGSCNPQTRKVPLFSLSSDIYSNCKWRCSQSLRPWTSYSWTTAHFEPLRLCVKPATCMKVPHSSTLECLFFLCSVCVCDVVLQR